MIYDNPFVAKKEKWESKRLVIFHFPKWKGKRKGAGDGCFLIASVFLMTVLFIYLLGLHWLLVAVHRLFLVGMRKGCFLAVVRRLVSVVAEAPLVGAQGPGHLGSVAVAHGLSGPLGTWDLPGPGMEPMSSELAGSFSTI